MQIAGSMSALHSIHQRLAAIPGCIQANKMEKGCYEPMTAMKNIRNCFPLRRPEMTGLIVDG